MRGDDAIFDIVWPANADWFATAARLGGIQIWNGSTGELEATLSPGNQGLIWDISTSPDGQLLAGAFSTGEVVLWDVPNRRELHRWMAHPNGESGVRAVAISPDKTFIVTGARGNDLSFNDGIAAWDLQGQRLPMFRDEKQWVGHLAFSPDGSVLAAADVWWDTNQAKKTLSLWKLQHNQRRFTSSTIWVPTSSFFQPMEKRFGLPIIQ